MNPPVKKLDRIAKREARVEKRYDRKMVNATLLKTPEQKNLAESPVDPNADWRDPAFRANAMKVVETDRKQKAGEWKARKINKLEGKKARVEARYQRKLSNSTY